MKLFWILTVSLGLRLIALNQSLWLDEAISANVVKNNSYREIVTNFSVNDFHPPLYYLVLKGWTSLFGYSEVSLRMPSVIFSLITIYVVYLMAGPAAAGLTGFNPLLIYYSQEARMYSMVTLFITLAIIFLKKKKYFLVSLFLGLGFMTFYGSVFLTAAIGAYLFTKRKFKELAIVGIGLLAVLGILWPLLDEQMVNSKEMLLAVKNWSLVLGKANLKNLLLIPMKFTSGRISFQPKFVYYLISGVWAVYVFGKMRKKNIYTFLFWATLAIGVIFSIFTPMLQYFRFLYLIPLMAIIVGKDRLMTIGYLVFSLFYLLNPAMHREDWKNIVGTLGNKVYMINSFADPVKYYDSRIKIYDLRIKPEEEKITVIPYGEEIHGIDHKNILESQGYKLVGENNFRQLKTENWQLSY